MKKIMILAAVAALALTACAKFETEKPVVDEPIAFGAYSGNALTKAGAYGELDNDLLEAGFGVFAYQTTGSAAIATPNFMYNTKVYGDPFSYDIIKYWPNQIQSGDTDSQPATAYAADKVSFFAYAPYVAATASSGAVASTTEGIVALTSNATSGDPKVSYKVSNDLDKQVDLCWGVVNPAANQTWTTVAGTEITLDKGMPFIGLQKPRIGTAVHFYFRHALAQITLKAVAAYNQTTAGGTAQNGVKITIASVELTVPDMPQTATLNLNNTTANTPKWENVDATGADLTLTVSGSNINADIKDEGAKKASAMTATGVTGSEKNVIVDGKYYTVIPTGTSTTVNVKVTYYVTTDDSDLLGGYSRVENIISHDVTFDDGFGAGTKNTIKMILGISEVKFEAEVSDWTTGDTGNIDLPLNS